MKLTVQLYGQFLMSSQVNYTGMYLVDYLDELTHDNVRYFLKKNSVSRPASSGSRCGRRWYLARGVTSSSTTRYSKSTTDVVLSWCAASTAATPTA